MPQSLSNIIVHLVFSTKHRQPFISPDIQSGLHEYMAVLIRDLGCQCHQAGGVRDHVHLSIRLSRTIEVADLVSKTKTGSCRWIKDQRSSSKNFAWQNGYAALSINPNGLTGLNDYIATQREHHRKVSFQEEYRALLTEWGVEFDERYMWD